MADPARARRLAVRIRQIVSSTLEMQIKDPRLGMVTITDARVTSDLREATVFYTVYGSTEEITDSAVALASATGVLRSTVGKQTGIKFVPTLAFVADIVPDTARELEEALERARYADAELARAREGAQYAGEADPYRKPAVDDEIDDQDDDTDRDADAGPDDAADRDGAHVLGDHQHNHVAGPPRPRLRSTRDQERPMTEAVDPDPQRTDASEDGSTLGGRQAPRPGADPTSGGKDGEIGAAPSVVADEPTDGSSYPVGGGRVAEESDQPPGSGG